jgi:hypothetical protein
MVLLMAKFHAESEINTGKVRGVTKHVFGSDSVSFHGSRTVRTQIMQTSAPVVTPIRQSELTVNCTRIRGVTRQTERRITFW